MRSVIMQLCLIAVLCVGGFALPKGMRSESNTNFEGLDGRDDVGVGVDLDPLLDLDVGAIDSDVASVDLTALHDK
jgi:hypothetical protein